MSERELMQESRAAGVGPELRLGRYERAVLARLERWESEGFGRRLWAKDHTLWSPEPVAELVDRLGWLKLPESMRTEAEELARFALEVRADAFKDAVVLGMGGSSLAPEVFARTFGTGNSAGGFPALTVLDSTHPEAVQAVAGRLDPRRTLFLVSSKSGTTTETLSLFRFFWEHVSRSTGREQAGRSFAAITDPGSSLEKLARERGFRTVFNAPEDVGGRYSALTTFGLVPAALIGADIRELLTRGRVMAEACTGPALHNPGLQLGAAMGELALAGRDKLTFLASDSVESFPDWIEQLVAESTGKIGRGIVPVVGERPAEPGQYGNDRFFVGLFLGDNRGDDRPLEGKLTALEAAGHPVARYRLSAPTDLGREMFRWEMATAAAGAVLGVNPFDQPDVQLAKEMATRAMKERASGTAAEPADEIRVSDAGALGSALEHWLAGAGAGSYLGVHAYVPATPETTEALHQVQALLRKRTRLAATFGYGPRFLHSTGQLHKGGPDSGRFLQIVDEPGRDLPVPETDFTFGTLIRAQADGDRKALEQRGRRVMRVNLGTDIPGGLYLLRQAFGV